jgi:hypothetical protein
MLIINLVPLALGEHMNFVANRCEVSFRAYAYIHKWLGRVAILERLVYIIAAVLSQLFNSHIRFRIKALIVSLLCSAKEGRS